MQQAPKVLHLLAQEKFSLRLPAYPGTACCMRIGGAEPSPASTSTREPAANGHSNGSVADMRQNYDRGGLTEEDADPDPLKMFDRCVCSLRLSTTIDLSCASSYEPGHSFAQAAHCASAE